MSVNDDSARGPARSRGGAASEISREELDRILTALGDVKGQLDSMKRDIARDRKEANDRLVKRLKLDKKAVFKRKGNERQFQFNAEVDEKLAAASSALDAVPLEIDRARKNLQEVEEVCLVEGPDVCLPGDQLAVEQDELWDCALPVP